MDEAESMMAWLMMPDAPNLDDIIAELMNRPSWHRQALYPSVGRARFFPISGRLTKEALA